MKHLTTTLFLLTALCTCFCSCSKDEEEYETLSISNIGVQKLKNTTWSVESNSISNRTDINIIGDLQSIYFGQPTVMLKTKKSSTSTDYEGKYSVERNDSTTEMCFKNVRYSDGTIYDFLFDIKEVNTDNNVATIIMKLKKHPQTGELGDFGQLRIKK